MRPEWRLRWTRKGDQSFRTWGRSFFVGRELVSQRRRFYRPIRGAQLPRGDAFLARLDSQWWADPADLL